MAEKIAQFRRTVFALAGSIVFYSRYSSAITVDNPVYYTKFIDVLNSIIGYFTAVIIPVGIAMILYAGFLYMTAGGNEQKVKSAHTAFLWGLVGIAIVLAAKGLITVVCTVVGASSCL